jgi:phage terminase large subunit GpA-like protein
MVGRAGQYRAAAGVWDIKGMAGARPAWPRLQSKAAKGKVYLIGVDSCKTSIRQRLKLTEGPGCIHFPTMVDLPFFEQMKSEYLKTEYPRGRPERSWERRKGRAPEAWDCAVYALAAIHGLVSNGISLDMEAERVALLPDNTPLPQASPYQVYRSRFMRGFQP